MSWPKSSFLATGIGYQPTAGRDLRIDLLRGCAVVAMIIDHLAGSSFMYFLTDGGHFFTSAAEGFVFISGFIGAVVYRRLATVHGLRSACVRILNRAGLLYALSVLLTLLVLPVSEYFRAGPCGGCQGMGISLQDPLHLAWAVVTLRQTYFLVDIPLLYTRLLLLAPLGLVLLTRGKTWLLVTLSFGVWAGYQLAPDTFMLGWTIADNTTFHLPSWQLVFFGGMVLGYHRNHLG